MAQMKKPVGKVRKTQAQIDAELAASKKAFEKYKATRPSKAKLAEIYTEQQSRLRRSKTTAPKPAVKRPSVKPAPLAPAPAKPKPRIIQMPSKISPSKMTPAQKAKYLQNPERYDK